MVHRNGDHYIQFVLFGKDEEIVRAADYGATVKGGFSSGAKSMLAPSNTHYVNDAQRAELLAGPAPV